LIVFEVTVWHVVVVEVATTFVTVLIAVATVAIVVPTVTVAVITPEPSTGFTGYRGGRHLWGCRLFLISIAVAILVVVMVLHSIITSPDAVEVVKSLEVAVVRTWSWTAQHCDDAVAVALGGVQLGVGNVLRHVHIVVHVILLSLNLDTGHSDRNLLLLAFKVDGKGAT